MHILPRQDTWRTFLRCAIYTPFFWERKNTPINGSAPPHLRRLGPSAGIKPLIFARCLEISWLFIFFLACITVSYSGQKKNRPNQARSLNRWRNSRLCSVSRPFNLGSRSARDVVHLYARKWRMEKYQSKEQNLWRFSMVCAFWPATNLMACACEGRRKIGVLSDRRVSGPCAIYNKIW